MRCVDALLSLYLYRSLVTSDAQVNEILAAMEGRNQPRRSGSRGPSIWRVGHGVDGCEKMSPLPSRGDPGNFF